MSLTEVIIKNIHKYGSISFCDFMEMSLYYPGLGYYTSKGIKIGKSGDYYTSPYLSPIFGAMIAKQIEEMWQILNNPSFTIIEYGAGTGILCLDILRALEPNKELYEGLRYCIIEKSPVMRTFEKGFLHEKVSWHSDLEDIPLITGCILSNELLDNFSVHRVTMERELMEVFVNYENGFVEELRPASDALKDYFEQLGVRLPHGFCTEINLEAIEWIKKIANRLKTGFVLTIDYGSSSSNLYHPERSSGTLLCYHKHAINDSPYQNIGEQDITAHVNFSALSHWGSKNGLELCGFTTQAQFLRSLGFANHLRQMEQSNKSPQPSPAEKAILLHTFLMDMGRKFKVLIQQKGMQNPKLAGLQNILQSSFL